MEFFVPLCFGIGDWLEFKDGTTSKNFVRHFGRCETCKIDLGMIERYILTSALCPYCLNAVRLEIVE